MGADGIDTPPPSADTPVSGTDSGRERLGAAPQRDEGTPLTDAAGSPANTAGPELPADLNRPTEGPEPALADWGTATKLPADATIDAGTYQFRTDDLGRVVEAYGMTLESTKAPRQPKDAGLVREQIPGGFDDQAGHLIAARFGGPGDHWNMVPQDRNLNVSEWKKLENEWGRALENGPVEVNITLNYHGDDVRPYAFNVEYSKINEHGETEIVRKDILNAPGAARDEVNPL
jgi:hypothetical protein